MIVKLTGFALTGLVAVALGFTSVALAAGGVTGTFTTTIKSPTEVKGKWAVTFGKTGGYVVALNGKAMARGRYSATATTITLREPAGCGGTGTYTWKRSGKLLMFTRKHEAASCQARAAVLTHRFTQVRSASAVGGRLRPAGGRLARGDLTT